MPRSLSKLVMSINYCVYTRCRKSAQKRHANNEKTHNPWNQTRIREHSSKMFAFVLFAIFLCHFASITFRRMIEWENRVFSCDFVDAFVTFDGKNTSVGAKVVSRTQFDLQVSKSIPFLEQANDTFRTWYATTREKPQSVTHNWVTSDSFSLDVSNNCWNRCKLLRFCFSLSTVGSYRTNEGKLVSFKTPIDTTAASCGALLGIIDEALLFLGGRGEESLQSVHFSIFIFRFLFTLQISPECASPAPAVQQSNLARPGSWLRSAVVRPASSQKTHHQSKNLIGADVGSRRGCAVITIRCFLIKSNCQMLNDAIHVPVDCSSSSKIAVRCHSLTINANWTPRPPTRPPPSRTAAPTSSAKLAPN